MQPIFRTQLVWVVFRDPTNNAIGTSLPFPDQPILNGNFIVGIEAVSLDQLSSTPDGVLTTLDLNAFSLTLSDGSDKRHQDMACGALNTQRTGGIYKELTPFVCDWQKSRVTRRNNSSEQRNESVPFMVYYLKPDDIERFQRTMAIMDKA